MKAALIDMIRDLERQAAVLGATREDTQEKQKLSLAKAQWRRRMARKIQSIIDENGGSE